MQRQNSHSMFPQTKHFQVRFRRPLVFHSLGVAFLSKIHIDNFFSQFEKKPTIYKRVFLHRILLEKKDLNFHIFTSKGATPSSRQPRPGRERCGLLLRESGQPVSPVRRQPLQELSDLPFIPTTRVYLCREDPGLRPRTNRPGH